MYGICYTDSSDALHCWYVHCTQCTDITNNGTFGFQSWEGVVHVKRKAGDIIANHCRIVPVTSNGGLV